MTAQKRAANDSSPRLPRQPDNVKVVVIWRRLPSLTSIVARHRKARELLQSIAALCGRKPVYRFGRHARFRLGLPAGVVERAAALDAPRSTPEIRRVRPARSLYVSAPLPRRVPCSIA